MRAAISTTSARLGGSPAVAVAAGRRIAARHVAARASGPASAAPAAQASSSSSSQPGYAIKMLYDGDCPLCMREVEMLQRRDAGKGRIAFVDVAAPEYDPAQNADISFQAAMERIHAVEADGRVLTDVEVFRRLYEEVGLGWVYAVTKNKTVESLANKVYDVWAKYRLPLTGRPDLMTVLREKKTCAAAAKEGGNKA